MHAKHCLILKKGKFLPTCTSSWKEEGMLIKMAQNISHKVCSSFPKKVRKIPIHLRISDNLGQKIDKSGQKMYF